MTMIQAIVHILSRTRSIQPMMILILFLSATLNCSTQQDLAQQKPALAFQLEKTGCLGFCPVYTLSIFSNREVMFRSIANTLVDSVAKTTLTKEEYDGLVKQFEQKRFMELDSSYLEPIMDAPSTFLTYSNSTGSMKVRVRGDAPEVFEQLENLLEDVARNARWLSPLNKEGKEMKEIIVQTKKGVDPKVLEQAFAKYEMKLLKQLGPDRPYFLFAINDSEEQILKLLRQNDDIIEAQWNHRLDTRAK